MKALLSTLSGVMFVAACASSQEPEPSPISMATITFGVGRAVDIMIVEPETPGTNMPVIVAFPWGAGDRGLTAGLISEYWDNEAPARGYLVIGVVTSTIDPTVESPAMMQALSDFLDENFSYDRDRLIITGASAGGRNLFFSSLAIPDRVAGILAMPGQWAGDASELAPLAGKPVRLMVGENDTSWRDRTDTTADALMAQGADVQVDVVPGQGHVLVVSQTDLMNWVDEVLARP